MQYVFIFYICPSIDFVFVNQSHLVNLITFIRFAPTFSFLPFLRFAKLVNIYAPKFENDNVKRKFLERKRKKAESKYIRCYGYIFIYIC